MLLPPGLVAAQEPEPNSGELALHPPHEFIPPTFMEQHGLALILVAVVLAGTIAGLLWWLLRPRPPVVLPPEVRARQTLETLQREPETDVVVSRATHALRQYVGEAFQLGTGELTTADFCRLSRGHSELGPELGEALREYFRQCDERKFAPSDLPPTGGHVIRALQLLNAAEARRRLVRLASDSQPPRLSATG